MIPQAITQDKFKELMQTVPAGTTKEQLYDFLKSKGHTFVLPGEGSAVPGAEMGPPVPPEVKIRGALDTLHNTTLTGMVENTVREAGKGLWNTTKGLYEGGKELLKGPGNGDPMQGGMTAGEGILQTIFSPISGVMKAMPEEGAAGAPRKVIETVGALPANAGVWIADKIGEHLGADTQSEDWKNKVERPIADAINIGMTFFGAKGKKASEILDNTLESTGEKLREGAKNNMGNILQPTKSANKMAVRNMGDQMMENAPMAMTREGLLGKLEDMKDAFGRKIGEYKDTVGIKGSVTKENLLNFLESNKVRENFVDSKGRILNPDGVKAVDAIKEIVNQYDDTIPLNELDALRQSLGDQIAQRRGFDIPPAEQTLGAQQRDLYGKIADETATQNPALAELNEPYSVTRKTADILSDTVSRKTGQSGIVGKAVEAAPAVVGMMLNKPGLMGISAYLALRRSTLWNLLAGKTKLKITKVITENKPSIMRAADIVEIATIASQALRDGKIDQEELKKIISSRNQDGTSDQSTPSSSPR